MAAFADSDTVVLDACDAAGSEPLYIADIGHFNSSLDAVVSLQRICSFPILHPGTYMLSEQTFFFNGMSVCIVKESEQGV